MRPEALCGCPGVCWIPACLPMAMMSDSTPETGVCEGSWNRPCQGLVCAIFWLSCALAAWSNLSAGLEIRLKSKALRCLSGKH